MGRTLISYLFRNGRIQTLLLSTLFFEIVLAAYLLAAGWTTVSRIAEPREDTAWAIYSLGLEGQKLDASLAAESNPALILLRAKIFVSRINLLFDSNAFQDIASLLPANEIGHVSSYGKRLAAEIANAEGTNDRSLNGIRTLVAKNSDLISALMLDLSYQHRIYRAAQRDQQALILNRIILVLALQMMSLGAIVFLVMKLNRSLAHQTAVAASKALETQTILDTTQDAVIGFDRNGTVLLWNPTAAQVFGRTATSVVGGALDAAVGGTIRDKLLEATAVHDGKSSLTSFSLEEHGKPHREISRVFSVSSHAFRRADGNMDDIVSVVSLRDVTSILADHYQSLEQRRTIEKIVKKHALAVLAARIAHEVNQPLAAIKNFVFLARATLESSSKEWSMAELLTKIGREADRLSDVTASIRKLEIGSSAGLRRVSLVKIVKGASQDAQTFLHANLDVDCELVGDDSVNIVSETDLYDSVITMISIVAETTKDGDRDAGISVRLRRSGGSLFLFVGAHPESAQETQSFNDITLKEIAANMHDLALMTLKRMTEKFAGHLEWWRTSDGQLSLQMRILT